MGISGMDGGLIEAKMKRAELGYVGSITGVNIEPVMDLLEKGYIPVISTLGCDREGNTYNINGDTAAAYIAGALGAERERRSRATVDATDIAVLLRSGHPEDDRWVQLLQTAQVPVVEIRSRSEANDQAGLLQRLQSARPDEKPRLLTGGLVGKDDIVVLVMPQDSEAPKGRLILPQVQVLRELLDLGCIPVCCQPEGLRRALDGLSAPPALTITDSQAFAKVNAILPPDAPLTSFSILLAGAKGDIRTFVESAKAIGTLKPSDRVLIAEACTHVPDTEDIGRVKIPNLLRKKVGGDLAVTIAAGNDFPDDLTPYRLIIQCGGCVATERLLRSRIRKAILTGVPITNYGIALAALTGILDRVVIPRS